MNRKNVNFIVVFLLVYYLTEENKMKKLLLTALLLSFTSGQAIAHSGRTDANGGHNCSQKSIEKGLCTGYHYHNDGSLHADLSDEAIDSTKISVKMEPEPHTHGDAPAHTHSDTKK